VEGRGVEFVGAPDVGAVADNVMERSVSGR
jgi:hypothetical protein